jgi:hypothetical protein
MRAVRSWVIGAAAAAALAPSVAVAGQSTSTLRVTAVVVRSVPIQLRPSVPPKAPRPAAPATAIARAPGGSGSIVFVDGAPTAFAFADPGAARTPDGVGIYPR